MAVKSEDFDKALKFTLCCIGKGDFTLKVEQPDAIKCIYDGKDVFLWLPTGFGKSMTLPFVFNYKHSDGGTGGGCSVVTPCVSDNGSHRRVNTCSCHTASGISISPRNHV